MKYFSVMKYFQAPLAAAPQPAPTQQPQPSQTAAAAPDVSIGLSAPVAAPAPKRSTIGAKKGPAKKSGLGAKKGRTGSGRGENDCEILLFRSGSSEGDQELC